jgi:hypothetical protein
VGTDPKPTGTRDCATVGGLSVANGLDRGADIVLLGELIEERSEAMSTTWMATKASGIDALDDLRGKTVVTVAAGVSTNYVQDDFIEERTGLSLRLDRGAPRGVRRRLDAPSTMRVILPSYTAGDDGDEFTMRVPDLDDAFDAAIFVRHTTASRLLANG